ncbi:hypothetical protein ACOSP6_15825 [Tenacibaculum sp. MEBiC06402]|uniref:hypothetical protein n=1 Tax=unclassified Tenacibaculum TaxID=2635139 RepID=UPI003B99179D
MRKLILLTTSVFFLIIGCSKNETTEELNDSEIKKRTSSKNSTDIIEKTGVVFNRLFDNKNLKEDLISIFEDDIMMLKSGAKYKFTASIFEDHIMMLTQNVFEDDILLVSENVFEDNVMLLTNNVFEDNVMLNIINSDGVIEDHVMMLSDLGDFGSYLLFKPNTIKDDVLPSACIGIRDDILKCTTTFEDIFNTSLNEVYPESEYNLEIILNETPNLYFAIKL